MVPCLIWCPAAIRTISGEKKLVWWRAGTTKIHAIRCVQDLWKSDWRSMPRLNLEVAQPEPFSPGDASQHLFTFYVHGPLHHIP